MKQFTTRKEQIEKDFLPRLMRDLRATHPTLSRREREQIRLALKNAAMCAAAEERHRTLRLLEKHANAPQPTRMVAGEIMKQGELKVLGYE